MSKDEETAVKVGSRHGKPVIYIVKAKQMYDDGYKFFISANGVWLMLQTLHRTLCNIVDTIA